MKVLLIIILVNISNFIYSQSNAWSNKAVDSISKNSFVYHENFGYGILYGSDSSFASIYLSEDFIKAYFIQLDEDVPLELIVITEDSNWDSDFPYGGTDWRQEYIQIFNIDSLHQMFSDVSYWYSHEYIKEVEEQWYELTEDQQDTSDIEIYIFEKGEHILEMEKTYAFYNGWFIEYFKETRTGMDGEIKTDEFSTKFVLINGKYVEIFSKITSP
ncbi:MAG: hypothetical protein MK105_18025 [Crocinitomicaceae bacterium]|nr:hypothetical protein [Crocinitomicaceae bacterium]